MSEARLSLAISGFRKGRFEYAQHSIGLLLRSLFVLVVMWVVGVYPSRVNLRFVKWVLFMETVSKEGE